MGEGHTEPVGSRNIVRTMATRDIYETSFDEDIQTRSSTIQCPGCNSHHYRFVETICEGCGLIIDEQRIDHGPEWEVTIKTSENQLRVSIKFE
jgi:transcription initiation factor TFIIB